MISVFRHVKVKHNSTWYFLYSERRLSLSDEDIIEVEHLILCTIKHTLTLELEFAGEWATDSQMMKLFERQAVRPSSTGNTDLTEIFLDFDLGILGAPQEDYDEYAAQIRREYSYYSGEEYRRGRKAVLEKFLDRKRLYFTDYFYELYESQARQNIQREIDSLL
jgi:predicted metal-dependent HD superfamily phosphohydrolase